MTYELRKSKLDRQDQLEDHDKHTVWVDDQLLILESRVVSAQIELEKYRQYVSDRERFREQLVESLDE